MVQKDPIELEKMMAWSKKKQTKKGADLSSYNIISRLTYKISQQVVDQGRYRKTETEIKYYTVVDYIIYKSTNGRD